MKPKCAHFLGWVAVVSVVLSSSAEANAPAGRYATNAGTVTDTKTKLTWQQTAPSATYTWDAAKTYCQTLSLAGTGWRLPTMKELQTIVDYSQSTVFLIDATAFGALANHPFWTSSTVAETLTDSQLTAWVVIFAYGTTSYMGRMFPNLVRCVR
jgi:hypothetical protein